MIKKTNILIFTDLYINIELIYKYRYSSNRWATCVYTLVYTIHWYTCIHTYIYVGTGCEGVGVRDGLLGSGWEERGVTGILSDGVSNGGVSMYICIWTCPSVPSSSEQLKYLNTSPQNFQSMISSTSVLTKRSQYLKGWGFKRCLLQHFRSMKYVSWSYTSVYLQKFRSLLF